MIGLKYGVVPLVLGALLIAWPAGCNRADKAYHKYIMRGAILDARGNEVDLCIGTRDGAKVGQELEVYAIEGRVTRANPSAVPEYRRIKTGVVRITAIYDEHYAQAVIVSGKAEKNAMAEIEIHE
ncbi:MAG: hypothetical protein EPN93_07715 [Spirochaetes bacterium]|nr:MAG: hypothetical protein EPN93_07715 [Spirochaetota bacterium]